MGNNSGELQGSILAVDDDEDVLIALRMLLKRHGATVHTEKDPEKIPSRLKEQRYDVILLDMNFTQDTTTGREGFLWLDRILTLDPSAVVILITAFGGTETAVRAIKEGAVDFVLKPWQNEKLLATVHAALQLSRSRAEVVSLRSRQEAIVAGMTPRYEELIGGSAPMQHVFATIDKVAGTDATVLILGENGTGKELVARAIHRKSKRDSEAFISVDVGALPQSLFESELFGYVKGAFTDARSDRAGRFEAASGGTLFLDEIGNISLSQQAKLLRVLETRSVTRVGSNKQIDVDIRLICATNAPIMDKVGNGEFRQDLLYRINTVEITLPPLRERGDDIPLLAEHFLAEFSRKYEKTGMRFSQATLQRLQKHAWPGNVRELQHAVERAVILADGTTLQPSDFFLARPEEASQTDLDLDTLNLDAVERKVILKAMAKHDGNIQRAARELGLTRPALYRRIEKHGL